jgi:arylsulfatase A-like enzyme
VPPPPDLPRPPPPREGLRNLVVVVLDSCRFDTFAEHAPASVRRLGPIERRWAYASWTGPSHYNLLTGLLPHRNPVRIHASQAYREDFLEYGRRLGTDVTFEAMLPGLWLPHLLKWGLGYRTQARVSLPVLHPETGISRDFDDYRLMDRHNDMSAMIDSLRFYTDRPNFVLLNVGETHYPYALAGEDASWLPRLHGVHGVAKKLARGEGVAQAEAPAFFDDETMDRLRRRQGAVVAALEPLFLRLWEVVPPGTWAVVTADHGELFGEGGFFGHGPIVHEKVWEVPFVEGLVR